MFTGQVSAYSIAHRNSDIFWKLDKTSRFNIAVKIVRGDYKYVSRFFNEQLNARKQARDHARLVVEKVAEELPRRLENTNIGPKSYDGYLALLNASRDEIRSDRLPKDVSTATMDRALQEECWAATLGDHGRPSGLFAARRPPPISENNQDRWGGVSSGHVQAALSAVEKLPESKVHGPDLLKLIEDHFEVFSGPIWAHKEARESLEEYIGLACAIHVLGELVDKSLYTEKDVKLLKSTLKNEDSPVKGDNNPMGQFSFAGSSEITELEIDPKNLDETRSRMIEAVYKHYFVRKTNLYGDKSKQFEEAYRNASDAGKKIEALKLGFHLLVGDNGLDKSRLVTMLDDLALLRRPIGNRESLVTDDD
jgi:hypothetical protein